MQSIGFLSSPLVPREHGVKCGRCSYREFYAYHADAAAVRECYAAAREDRAAAGALTEPGADAAFEARFAGQHADEAEHFARQGDLAALADHLDSLDGRPYTERIGATAAVTTSPDREPAQGSGEEITAPQWREGYFTVSTSAGHRTFRIRRQDERANFWPGHLLLAHLTGSDNTSDYTSIGVIRMDGSLRLWKKHSNDAELLVDIAALQASFDDALEQFVALAGTDAEVMASARCLRCPNMLTNPESLRIGMGPVCRNK